MPKSLSQRLYATPTTVVVGTPQNFDARGYDYFTILSPTGSTVTFSRVMTIDASAHVTDPTDAQETVASNTMNAEAVDWPFYRVSTVGGSCQVSLV